jgi:hypothetical protein
MNPQNPPKDINMPIIVNISTFCDFDFLEITDSDTTRADIRILKM